MWQQLNPTADPFASLPKQYYYHTVTNVFATNVIVGDQTSPGMESIFALQSPNWLHDIIITWWLGYWCEKTGGLSNFSITNQRQRPSGKIDGQRKTFFATPFFWKFVLDAETRGANETSCSRGGRRRVEDHSPPPKECSYKCEHSFHRNPEYHSSVG